MRLLVIERNPKLNHLIASTLSREGFKVDSFVTPGSAAPALQNIKSYRLAVLDVEAWADHGIHLIKEIRNATTRTTILAMTSQEHIDYRVRILDAGADDLVIKPFPLAEMAAHCRALLRRASHGVQETTLEAGNINLNTGTYEVFINNKRVHFTKREVNLLTQLMRQFDRIVTKANLLNSLFAFADDPSPNAIEAIISKLRRKLTTSSATIAIQTHHGIGYVLTHASDIV